MKVMIPGFDGLVVENFVENVQAIKK